jgi:hypothetical protein
MKRINESFFWNDLRTIQHLGPLCRTLPTSLLAGVMVIPSDSYGRSRSIGGLILGTTHLDREPTSHKSVVYYVLHPASTDKLAQPDHTVARLQAIESPS